MLQIDMKRRYLHTSLKQKSQNFQLNAVMYEHYSYIWHVGMRRWMLLHTRLGEKDIPVHGHMSSLSLHGVFLRCHRRDYNASEGNAATENIVCRPNLLYE